MLFKQLLNHSNCLMSAYFKSYSNSAHLIEKMATGLPLTEVVKQLNDFAPIDSAESWDNAGLLMDPMETKPIKLILLTNDLTEDVMEEAVYDKVDMIISYHPPIFKPLKSVTARTWKERLVVSCLKNRIALYSPHTSWDAHKFGVNHWLCNAFKTTSSVPIFESGSGRICSLEAPITVKKAVEKLKEHIKIPHLRLALGRGKTLESEIKKIAVCAGSGSSVLCGVDADLYLTGEMLHHDILEATQNYINVILCNHSDSERGFLQVFSKILKEELLDGKVEVKISEKDADPLVTV